MNVSCSISFGVLGCTVAKSSGEVAGLTPEDIDFDAAGGIGTFSMSALLDLLNNADPAVKAQLRLALMT